MGKICYYYDYNKGEIFYKIYDYDIQVKKYKKEFRLKPVRELKRYKEKKSEKIIQETVTSFFKLNKGLE